jgi:hypothetical protein
MAVRALSRIEILTKAYLRQNKIRQNKYNRDLLRKVITLIDLKLLYNTCEVTEPVIDLHTLKEDWFTNVIYNMLLNIGRDGNRQSLRRVKELIEKYINE